MELYSEILLKGLNNVKANVLPTFNDLFYKKQDEIKKLIKERWILGKRPDGSLIGEYHNYGYAKEKATQNPRAGFLNVDLIDTGALVEAIKISMFDNGFEVFSTDSKYNSIFDKYGADNFNITDKESEEIINQVLNSTIEYLYKKYIL